VESYSIAIKCESHFYVGKTIEKKRQITLEIFNSVLDNDSVFFYHIDPLHSKMLTIVFFFYILSKNYIILFLHKKSKNSTNS